MDVDYNVHVRTLALYDLWIFRGTFKEGVGTIQSYIDPQRILLTSGTHDRQIPIQACCQSHQVSSIVTEPQYILALMLGRRRLQYNTLRFARKHRASG